MRSTSTHSRARSRALKCGDGGETAPEMRRRLFGLKRAARLGLAGAVAVLWAFAAPARRPKLRGPGALTARHGGLSAAASYRRSRPSDAAMVPEAVGRLCLRQEHGLKR